MKKVKMYISFLLFLLFASSQVKAECSSKAKDIPVYKVKSIWEHELQNLA